MLARRDKTNSDKCIFWGVLPFRTLHWHYKWSLGERGATYVLHDFLRILQELLSQSF